MTKRILCVSFSPLQRDSRVRRQLDLLGEFGDVTSLGYGPPPEGVARHLEIPERALSLPQTPAGVLRLAARAYGATELTAPGERAALRLLDGAGPFDLIAANDARALPVAFRIAGDSVPVWADLHEWAPQENSRSLPWRLLVGPYMDALCRRYLSRAAAVTTVNGSLARLYAETYGIPEPGVVRSAGPYRDLPPTPLEPGVIRLVHSGSGTPERNIEALIDAALVLGDRVTLDLYLVATEARLAVLRSRARASDRIRFHPPVEPTELPATLNRYDLGVFVLPIRSINNRFMLPNKFFDFVQARLGLVFGSAVETDRIIRANGLGVIAATPTAEGLVDALAGLTAADVERFKAASDRAARGLSDEADLEAQRELVGRLLDDAPGTAGGLPT